MKKYKFSKDRITVIACISWVAFLFTGRTIVGLFRPAPFFDRFTFVWLFVALASLLVTTWTIVAYKWNDLLIEMEAKDEELVSDLGIHLNAKIHFESRFTSPLKYSRNAALVMFVLGIIGVGYKWSEPESSTCSMDSNGDLSCLNDLSMSGTLVLASFFAMALWYHFAQRTNNFYRNVLPDIEAQQKEIDFTEFS